MRKWDNIGVTGILSHIHTTDIDSKGIKNREREEKDGDEREIEIARGR